MVRPSRRQLLSALYAAGGGLLAGCLAPGEPTNTTATDTPTADDSASTSTESNQAAPDFPGETASNSCPPFKNTNRVVCYEAVEPEEVPLVLVPETQSVSPNRPTEFTLRNRSGQQFRTNFYHWQLFKHVNGDWYYIAPHQWPEPMTPLAAGKEHIWTVAVATDRVSDGRSIEYVTGTESLTIAGLGGGHYAFGIEGWFTAGSHEESIALAAGFELNADPLQLTPTEAVAQTEWDGETLVAHSTRGEPEGEADQPDAFVLERTDGSGTETKRVIIEQVVRNDQLRDAIALSQKYEADRVRLEEFSRSFPPFGLQEARTYEFRNNNYRVTASKGGQS